MTGRDAGPDAVLDAYLEHLSVDDLTLLQGRSEGAATIRDLDLDRTAGLSRLEELLGDERTFAAVFGTLAPSGPAGPLLHASPFLVFAVAVHRAAVDLATRHSVPEWIAPGRSAPVFDVHDLSGFLAGPWRRLFLAELLASYTHVASGSVFVATRRGWRRQRFSELDPVRLAGLLDVVEEAERPGIYRRLGDLALFLTGVFPDHTAQGWGPAGEERLVRSSRRAHSVPVGSPGGGPGGPGGAVGLLEQLGRRWYGLAAVTTPAPVPTNLLVLRELPERFSQARRILHFITGRFLFGERRRWFGLSG